MSEYNNPSPPEPEDSINKLLSDLAADVDAGAFMRAELDKEAEAFLSLCTKCAQHIVLMDDVVKARSIMLDVTIWATELRKQMARQVVRTSRPKTTATAFTR